MANEPSVPDPWQMVLDGAAFVHKNRAELLGFWGKLQQALRKRNENILVTGMPGAGKTVLVDHFNGKAYQRGYADPGKSVGLEKTDLKQTDGRAYSLLVIPGQDSPQRTAAVQSAFNSKERISGLIHVVSNGFNTTRGFEAERIQVDSGIVSINDYLNLQREQEIQHFSNALSILRNEMLQTGIKPWIIVALGKVDLYATHQEVDAAKRRYGSPEGYFGSTFRSFSNQVGTDNFSYTLLPICSALNDFVWNADKVESTLQAATRDNLIGAMLHTISQHVGWQP